MRKGFCDFVSWLCVLSLVFLITGCDGGGGDDDESSESTAAAVPTWTGSFHMTNPDGQQETINLEQNNSDITGSTTLGGTATGTANGSNAEITINYPDSYFIILNLTINITIINGTFNDSEGRNGSVEATKDGSEQTVEPASVPSNAAILKGEWLFIHNETYDETDGVPEGQDSKNITFQQTGDHSFSFVVRLSDPPVDWRFNGTIDGNNVTIRMEAPGTEVYTGTMSQDGNSMSGEFEGHSGDDKWGGTWSATRQI